MIAYISQVGKPHWIYRLSFTGWANSSTASPNNTATKNNALHKAFTLQDIIFWFRWLG